MANVKARIILRGSKTYNFGGKRWIKDVPGVVIGEDAEIKQFEENGYFLVRRLKASKADKAMKLEGSSKKKASSKSLESKGSGSKSKKSKGTKLKK